MISEFSCWAGLGTPPGTLTISIFRQTIRDYKPRGSSTNNDIVIAGLEKGIEISAGDVDCFQEGKE
jgi:hypothetical protein